jgi:hypothetical protein
MRSETVHLPLESDMSGIERMRAVGTAVKIDMTNGFNVERSLQRLIHISALLRDHNEID